MKGEKVKNDNKTKSTMLVRMRNKDGTFSLVRVGKLKSSGSMK